MKKFMIMALAAVLALNLAACSKKTDTTSAVPAVEPPVSQAASAEAVNIKTYVGQVSDKVGNDIQLSLGKFVIDDNGGGGQMMMVDENGEQRPVDGDVGGEGGETIMVPAPADGGTEGGEGGGDASIEKLPIEFTGEVQEFTIPAGAKILNAMGKEVTLDSVQKGSLVQLIVNEGTGVVETVMVLG